MERIYLVFSIISFVLLIIIIAAICCKEEKESKEEKKILSNCRNFFESRHKPEPTYLTKNFYFNDFALPVILTKKGERHLTKDEISEVLMYSISETFALKEALRRLK